MPKISRDGLDISAGCATSADGDAGSATGAEPAAGAVPTAGADLAAGVGSGNVIRLGVSNAGSIEGVKITFEFSKNS